MIGILTKQNVERSLSTLTGADIYIAPELGDIRATDFARYEEAAATGHAAANRQLSALQALSVSPEVYALWAQKRRNPPREALVIDEIVIADTKRVHPDFIARHIQQQKKQILDRSVLEQDLIRTYGDGYYDSVDYRVVRHDERNTLEILVREKDWGSDYLTFGFAIDNEYKQGSSFNFRSAYRNTWMNSYGGEFFAAIDVGGKPSLELNFYQPLTPNQSFFVEPLYSRKREDIGLYSNDKQIVAYQLDTSFSELTLGKNMGVYGQSKLGWREYHMRGTADISAVVLPDVDERYGGIIYELNLDRRNRLYFPSHGWRADISYFDSSREGYKKLSLDLGAAYKLDQYVIGARAAHITSLEGALPLYDAVMLGGFLNMSGYASNQILGDDALYAHVRAERIIGRMPLGLNGDLRLGLGIEAARLEEIYTLISDETWLDSAVIYLGGETPLGPLYLGYGFTFSGDYNLYLQLGAL
jgi:NTE family protein